MYRVFFHFPPYIINNNKRRKSPQLHEREEEKRNWHIQPPQRWIGYRKLVDQRE